MNWWVVILIAVGWLFTVTLIVTFMRISKLGDRRARGLWKEIDAERLDSFVEDAIEDREDAPFASVDTLTHVRPNESEGWQIFCDQCEFLLGDAGHRDSAFAAAADHAIVLRHFHLNGVPQHGD